MILTDKKMNFKRLLTNVSIGLILTLLYSSCSISMKLNGASVPENLKTFSVQYIENRAPLINPQLSQTMTEKLKDRISNESRLKMVTNTGDVDFSGVIRVYSIRPMAIQADAVSSQTRLTIEVEIKYINFKNPKDNWTSKFSAYEDYESSQNINAIEAQLVDLIVDKITENVFNKAFANW
jgi:hypothetical protein